MDHSKIIGNTYDAVVKTEHGIDSDERNLSSLASGTYKESEEPADLSKEEKTKRMKSYKEAKLRAVSVSEKITALVAELEQLGYDVNFGTNHESDLRVFHHTMSIKIRCTRVDAEGMTGDLGKHLTFGESLPALRSLRTIG